MVTYYVKQNELYTVTATVECAITDGNGSPLETCAAGRSVTFKVTSPKIKLSDDNAILRKAVTESGGVTQEVTDHIDNEDIHLTSAQKTKISKAVLSGETASFPAVHVGDVVANTVYASTLIEKSTQLTEFKSSSVLNKAEADSLYAGLIGEIKWYAGASVPAGYLLCDGTAISRTTYAKLFSAIGTAWGEGDGSTTFNLPNLIDKVAWGAIQSGEYLEAGLPNITGSLVITDENSEPAYLVVNTATGAFDKAKQSGELNLGFFEYGHPQTGRYTKTTFDASRSSAIYGKSSTVQPPAAKLIPIIKY